MRFFFSSQRPQTRPGGSSGAVSSHWFRFRPPRLSLSILMGCQSSKPITEVPVTLAQLEGALEKMKQETNAQLEGALEKMQTNQRAELEGALEKMQTNQRAELNEALNPIKTEINVIKAVLLVPDGDEEAKLATVGISTLDCDKKKTFLGHGVVVLAPDHRGDDAKKKFYLLSAAHVLVAIAKEMTAESKHLQLSWPQTTNALSFKETKKGAMILHQDYISRGSHDYGFMELKSLSLESCPLMTQVKDLDLETPKVGQSVVARGRVYLRGIVTGVHKPSHRFSVLAHSVPGSSGSPIFSNDRKVVGVVHGSSKHKGHTNENSEDDAAVVYGDAIKVTKDLFEIPEDHWNWLSMAEEVPPEVASGKKKLSRIETTFDESGEETKVEVQTEDTEDLWTLCAELEMDCKPMSKVTLENIMAALKEKLTVDKNRTCWEDRKGFELVFVSNPTSPEQSSTDQPRTSQGTEIEAVKMSEVPVTMDQVMDPE